MGALAITVWTALTSYILLKLIDVTVGLRVELQEEILGADLVEHAIGDIQYDKVEQHVVHLSRQQPLGPPPSEDATNMPSYNEARKRRHTLINQDLVRKASVILGALATSDVRRRNGDSDKAPSPNGHVRGMEGSGPVAEVTVSRLPSKHTVAGERRKQINTLWKFAVGKTLNKEERKRRAKARDKFSFIFSQTKSLANTSSDSRKTDSPAPSPTGRKSSHKLARRSSTSGVSTGERWRLAHGTVGNGEVNRGLTVDTEYMEFNSRSDRGRSKVTDDSVRVTGSKVNGDSRHSHQCSPHREDTIESISVYV